MRARGGSLIVLCTRDERQPAAPGETTRAYLRHSPEGIDDTLARNDEAVTARPFVCKFAGDDGGPAPK